VCDNFLSRKLSWCFGSCLRGPKSSFGVPLLTLVQIPQITRPNEISGLLGFEHERLSWRISHKRRYYRQFSIPKRTGGQRLLSSPDAYLKRAQNWIRQNILSALPISPHATAYSKGSKTFLNAARHSDKRYVLRMDLKNFFDNIKFNAVEEVFTEAGYNAAVSNFLAELCTFDLGIPQGAPTSPRLSNLISRKMDAAISIDAWIVGASYTRYADDIVLSSDDLASVKELQSSAEKIVMSQGFSVNKAKTWIAGPGHRKKITGLVIGSNGVGIGRKSERYLRAMIHQLSAQRSNYESRLARINGYLSYVRDVDPVRYARLKTQLDAGTN
jgi:RNA-directed DNA polymerase